MKARKPKKSRKSWKSWKSWEASQSFLCAVVREYFKCWTFQKDLKCWTFQKDLKCQTFQIDEIGHLGGDRSSIGADQCKSFVIFIQISLTPGQVATDVCQALEYSTWKAHVHINQRIPTPVSKELLSEDILRMAHTVHSVPLSIFRAQGPPDSLLSSCDPPF